MTSIKQKRCLRCDHEWLPRSAKRPIACPQCKARNWDIAKPVVDETVQTGTTQE